MNSSIQKFQKDWARDAEIASLCTCIFEFLNRDENRLEHFSFARLKSISGATDDTRLAHALQYLSSPRCLVLKQIFLFFDGDDAIEFSSSEMAEIYREGAFVHPSLGIVVRDLDQISVAFESGDLFSREEGVSHG
ncbi:MAG: hypothetical protein HY254_10255 [Burkholderiales bacterium]|nr:hypothetical protein [Burkholderiales bacterium]